MKPDLLDQPAARPAPLTSTFVDIFGGRYCRLAHVHQLPPFFMNIVSSSDLWLFLASNGGLTAGRVNAEGALFPYQTVDRIYDSAGVTGPFTDLRVRTGGREVRWEPFAEHAATASAIARHLYKSVEGDRVWFEEHHAELGLAFRYGWSTTDRFGFVRRCELENLSPLPRDLRLVDGLRNLLPPGINARLQNDSSCLVDAYKSAELLGGTSLAVYALSSGITDRAIPMESLRASIVWSEGLPGAEVLLSDAQLGAFHSGAKLTTETHARGVRCTYALATALTLAPGARVSWLMVADTGLTQADVAVRRRALAAGTLAAAVGPAVDESTRRLRRLVAAADGCQAGGAEGTAVHHFANTLFNVMRGGVFASGYELPGEDFAGFVRIRNRRVAARHTALLAALPATLPRADLLARLAATGDRDLERLGLEYLPLTFSRRHGDPSRPWNRFNIHVRDATGARVLNHEGNWRDIFQNWEALCLSFPDFFESIVAKFLNASTVDGYNPYRVSREGIEWEVPEAENPWASIGYWGDHQTVYLLKLLEWSRRFHPDLLAGWLRRDLFSYADVPYRIAGYDAMRRDPHVTIEFDAARHHAILQRAPTEGSDARLLPGPGGVLHVNLTEKLLVLLLTRLTNFVPGGGIWMNTQRPEWNDANNALVGYGVSLVTLCYLRRFLAHVERELFPSLAAEPVPVSSAVADLAHEIAATLQAHEGLLARPQISDADRRLLLDRLAAAGTNYRATVYRGGPGPVVALAPADLHRLLALARAFVEHTLRANRRPDGLYHAYNLLEFTEQPAGVKLHHLAPMLEGQVAMLSSGLLTPAEAAALLAALRASPLYRADQHSYLLYPDRQLPGFLERNLLPADATTACPLLARLLDGGDPRLVQRDADGRLRFHPDLVNRAALDERLQLLARDSRWAAEVPAAARTIADLYERVFHHRAYTGRSGSMFGYEGLGCIYWHMVAKLLLATQEILHAAETTRDPAVAELTQRYYDIRAGLGFNKPPAAYGAFPTDPYSHTPGHAGAQQPGMTGQVKEEILTRFGELGVHVIHGRLELRPTCLRRDEFTAAPAPFRHPDPRGEDAVLPLPAGALAFTFCGVPVVYQLSSAGPRLRVHFADGRTREITGTELDASLSAAVFSRSGVITRIEAELGCAFSPLPC